VHIFDGSSGASGAVGRLALFLKTDESEGFLNSFLVWPGHQEDRLDVSVLSEVLSQLLLLPLSREVLHVNVIDDLPDVSRLPLLILFEKHLLLILHKLHRLLEPLFSLEAHEAIVIGGGAFLQVFVRGVGDLTRLNCTKLCVEFLQLLGVEVAEVLHKGSSLGIRDVSVVSKKLLIKR
jgi:hypothetical protein